ncbi:Asp-tRNA(Asn)/Glu-tRNA(Gln) amidotransferase subunit GatC [Candidatus Daviesbacteria bacterium]|nr:Asp-tRNA(Asn)/Glu-tRNA(Gln) amidotransferase subunit GatC [Candidatus Daviesbacteria bacterium]
MKIRHVIKLANLPLAPEEEEKYSQQLSKILDYIKELDSVDTSGVEPTFNVSGQKNIMAEDNIGSCLPQDEVLSNATQKRNGLFVTKGVFEE